MNELSVRLTADIAQLQSALAKAKKTISEFEKETTQESEKGNVGFRRKIGLIEALTQKSKQLREALSKATNEKDIERYNQELEQTIKEMSRLNALGRQVTNTLGGANNGFNQATKSIGSANGVALEFNRIIQDAPFGIIGIGNNLQQLAGNFSAASKEAGGAGKAIAASLSALVSPANLVVLGISAITAAFTAYQLGAFDFLKSTEDSIKTLEDYRESLDAVTRASIEGAAQGEQEAQSFRLLRAQAENANASLKTRLDAVNELKSQYPSYLKNLSDEQILTGNVGDAYDDLTKSIVATARARAFSNQIGENSLDIFSIEERALNRVNQILEKRNQIQEDNNIALALEGKAGETNRIEREAAIGRAIRLQSELDVLINEQINDVREINAINSQNLSLEERITQEISNGAKFTKEIKDETKKATKEVEFFDKAWNDSLDTIDRNYNALKRIAEEGVTVSLNGETADVVPTGIIEGLKEQIDLYTRLREAQTDTSKIQEYGNKILELQGKLNEFNLKANEVANANSVILDSFSALGIGIASSLDISNNALKGFITTVLSSTPKIIAAIIAQAQANKAAAAITNQANAQQAAGNVVVSATEAAKGLGPVGLAVLPVLIAGGLALISSAFSKTGASVPSGGGGGSIGAPPQIFTNNPQSFSPNYTGFNGGSPLGQLELTATASYDNIIFGLGQYQEARNRS